MVDPVVQTGAIAERDDALDDVKELLGEYGEEITIKPRTESDVDRDRYSSLARRRTVTGVTMNAYPIEFSPTRHRLERAGLKLEQTRVIVWTAQQDWDDAGLKFASLDIKRWSVTVRGTNYLIGEKQLASQFLDTFLYVTLALTKE